VISTVVTYTLMLFGLVTAYFLLVYAISVFTASVVDADNPIIMAVAIFFIAVLFVPVRTRLQERIENLFFRRRYQLQARIETFARELGARTSLADVLAAYRTEIETTLQPEHLFIFMPDPQTGDFTTVGDAPNGTTDIRFTSTSGLIAALTRSSDAIALDPGVPWDVDLVAERARLNILRAQMLFAMRGSTGTLYGVVIVARPRGQRKSYALEEARYLQNLTAQISVAVERAQAVSTLERRVRELDVLSQISQAVNFTAAYDDLLELIATQAGRLIDVDTLYLTLRDADHDTLYHAFFLENDERLLAREGVRWPIGRDLFSDVVRTAQPLRVRSFTGAMAERGAGPRPESADLRGWMGVPMLVGSRVIGVLSAATTQPGRVFSDDQMKIFGDIASLAATSLDKARLFAETNARARQLSVLNEISRQLVAAEADLEGLLLVITQSSVDILGGEAGSLLLESDDGSGDLEFQIAVGESGNTLKGLRVPAGKGLVGEVASTGQSRIVNDVSTDPRWGGEFAGGAFRTTSILAVPLVTPDRVIGVLEVLNKANGASFTPEDAELLNTFAGQAAVAIENARLFQLTDQQLSQRVRELETLERIDVELNRSLDLAKVARITVEWARENSAAEAAVLGLVSAAADGTPVLDRVASEGYTADDVPPGAEPGANRWPLDRGALERVLRTRQPELIVDAGRADYRPILRGAKSMIVLPMLSAGLVNALLILETKREGGFRIADMPFLQRLTEHASIAITNAQLYAELTRANESKNEFVSFVAHELKNPLTAIKGYSEFLINGALGQLSEPQRNFVTTIRGSADRMTTIVSDLNDVTKLETNNLRMDFAPIAFAAVVTDTLLPLEKQIADKAQVLVLELDEALPDILADHNRLIQVLTNMVSNAHKYSPPGGTITIRADVDTMLTDSKGKRRPPMLHVQVRDTGIGMSAEDLSRLFTPYFRSENPLTREQPGTGLGMTITRGIIDRHGGTIWVESTLGAGTVFHFTLPLAETPVLP
jgi:signal transduction histidine kinase